MALFKTVFVVLFSIFSFLCLANTELHLSKQERQFIKDHPVIKIAAGESFEPFIFQDENGVTAGYDKDIADLIEEKTGLKIEFEFGAWDSIQMVAEKGHLEGLSTVAISEKRQKRYNFSKPYLKYTAIVIVNRDNHHGIYKQEHVQHKRAAVQRGNVGFEQLTKALGDVEIVYYDDFYSVLHAVVNNEVDFTVLDESVYYIADKLGVGDFIATSFVIDSDQPLHFAFTKKYPLLVSIVNKALDDISLYQRAAIKAHWFRLEKQHNITFTQQEKEYLKKKDEITYCIHSDFYPIESRVKGVHVGISAAFLAEFQKHMLIPFKLIETDNWRESLVAIQDGSCDFLPMAMKAPYRTGFLNFTDAYLSTPLVIATKKHVPFIQNMESLNHKKIGVVKEYAYSEVIRKLYPDIKIVEVDNIQIGLSDVEKGTLFGFMGALPSISFQFQKGYVSDLKITGRFDEKLELSVATRKDDLILLGIFEKLTTVIDSEKQQDTLNKYISVNYEGFVDYSIVYKVIGASFLILVITLVWNQRLQHARNALNKLYEELKIKDKKLEDTNRLLEKANCKLEYLSSTDKLTGICNRRSIDESLANEVARSKRTGECFSVILIDIDFFKTINDTFGHQAGDTFLIELCQLIKNNVREVDTFGRWGGEEFLIISPNSTKECTIKHAERLRGLIEKKNFSIVEHRSASFGVASYQRGDDFNSLLKRADSGLYDAKNSGRNKVSFSE